jgi:hypothetical protein
MPIDYGALAKEYGGGEPIQSNAVGRFVSNAADQLNPMNLVRAALHPADTVKALLDAHKEQYEQAKQLYDDGRYVEAAGHLGAAALPLVGPAAAHAGEQIASGDVAGGLGSGAGLIGSVLAPRVVAQVPGAVAATGDAVARAAGAVRDVASHPVVQRAAIGTVRPAATVAGAAVGGWPGAWLGNQVGSELADQLRARGQTPPAPQPPTPPPQPPTPPPQPPAPVEGPLALTQRLRAEHLAQQGFATVDEAKAHVDALREAAQAARAAAAPPEAPVAAPAAPGAPSTLLNPDWAKSLSAMRSELAVQARRLGMKGEGFLTDGESQRGVQLMNRGVPPDVAAQAIAARRMETALKAAPDVSALAPDAQQAYQQLVTAGKSPAEALDAVQQMQALRARFGSATLGDLAATGAK